MERYFVTTDRIAANLEIFPVKFDDYRRALVPKSYLAIYYFVEPERAVIVAVVALWLAFETAVGGNPMWMIIAGAVLAYSGWTLLIAFPRNDAST